MNIFTKFFRQSATLAMGLFCFFGTSAAVNFVANPDPQNMIPELSSVTLTFPDATSVDLGSRHQNVTITSENFNRSCTLEYGDEDNQMIISFSKITDPETYTINIPADAITADNSPVEAFTITYKVGVEQVLTGTLIPEPGDVDWLYEIIFNDPAVEYSLSVNSSLANDVTVTYPSGDVAKLTAVYDYQIGNGKYRFRLPKLATEEGKYKINFPEKYFYYNDATYTSFYLPAYEFEYEVKGGELTRIISDPSMTEPTFNFDYLNIEFPGYTTVAIKEMSFSEKQIYVYQEGKDSYVSSFYIQEGADYFTIEGNKISWVNKYSELITPGSYYMTFPEGCILLGEDQTPSTPFVVEFKIVAPEPVTIDITPAADTTVSMLNSAVISFPDLAQVDLGKSSNVLLSKVTFVDDQEKLISVGSAYGENQIARLSDNSFRASFSGLATEDGDYRITVATNSFVFEGGYNQEYSVDVKFVAPEAPEYAMSPSNSEALPRLQKFTISFPNESVVKLNQFLSNKTTTLYAGEEITVSEYGYITNSQIGTAKTYTAVEGSTNSFTFSLSASALDAGKYVLRIPAGVFLMGENANNFNTQIEVVYECNGEGIDKIEVNPSVPVKELNKMEITFINETSIRLQTDYTGVTLYKFVEGQSYGSYIEYISGADHLSVEGNKLIIKPTSPITEEGRYYIELSAYTLFMSDGTTTSTPQKVFFTVDPNATVNVESIIADSMKNRIFTITGLEVKDIKSPGIYIVNGKKIIVR